MDPKQMDDVGQGRQYDEAVKKYDAEHGTYKSNVPLEPNLPNANPAGPDPSPYKIEGGR